ncbi:hypothetical protein MTO96_008382 [Rhipicephalus appendiculatus]
MGPSRKDLSPPRRALSCSLPSAAARTGLRSVHRGLRPWSVATRAADAAGPSHGTTGERDASLLVLPGRRGRQGHRRVH